jgi:hypothetical protein
MMILQTLPHEVMVWCAFYREITAVAWSVCLPQAKKVTATHAPLLPLQLLRLSLP